MHARTVIVSVVLCVTMAAIVALLLRTTYDARTLAHAPELFEDVDSRGDDGTRAGFVAKVDHPTLKHQNITELLGNECNPEMGIAQWAESRSGVKKCNLKFANDIHSDHATTDGVMTVKGDVIVNGANLMDSMQRIQGLTGQVTSLAALNDSIQV